MYTAIYVWLPRMTYTPVIRNTIFAFLKDGKRKLIDINYVY